MNLWQRREKLKKEYPDTWSEERNTYRSMGHAFNTIDKAIKNPNEFVEITDHTVTVDGEEKVLEAGIQGVVRKIKNIINNNNLEGFFIHESKRQLIFSLKEDLRDLEMIRPQKD